MIYFVRHGETDWNVTGMRQGWTGNSINAKGREQAENAINEICKLKPDYFYSSDLMRAKQTATIFNKTLNMPIIYDWRLRESNHGIMAGATFRYPKPPEMAEDFFDFPHKYGAESKQDVFNRVKDFVVNEIIAKGIDNALIVSHGGTICMFKYIKTHKDFNKEEYYEFMRNFKCANTQVVEMDFSLYNF